MGDSNNNRTTTIVQTTKKSGEAQFDITALLSKHPQNSDEPVHQKQNKDSNLKYPNFWPAPAIQNSTPKHQKTPFPFIPLPTCSPISNRRNDQNNVELNRKSMKTTLRDLSPDLSQRLTNEGIDWIRLSKTPSELSNASDDEFIIRCFTAESTDSNNSSIRWADDAIESEWTEKLQKQWLEIEQVCASSVQPPNKPPQMSQTVYNECLEWRRAFPCQDKPRFLSSSQRQSPISPTIDSPSDSITPRSSSPFGDNQDYVHTWLTQCQQTSTGYSSLPIQSAKAKDVIKVSGEKCQFEGTLTPPGRRIIENISPPASLSLNYRPRIKVQRPISSHVRGHTITPLSTGINNDRDRRKNSKHSSYLTMIDEQELSRSRYPKSPTEGVSMWSRHEHNVIQEESRLVSTEVRHPQERLLSETATYPNKTKSFVDWLFNDDIKRS